MRERPSAEAPPRIRATAVALLGLVLLQIYFGALVAGLRAGLIYNTWPLIDGSFIPDAARLAHETPLWRNFFENNLTVQFNHRMMAYLLLVVAIWHSYDVASSTRDRYLRALASLFVSLVLVQAFIGIVTLLYSVPIPLALLHQAMAIVLLTIATLQAARLLQRQPIASQERGYAASA